MKTSKPLLILTLLATLPAIGFSFGQNPPGMGQLVEKMAERNNALFHETTDKPISDLVAEAAEKKAAEDTAALVLKTPDQACEITKAYCHTVKITAILTFLEVISETVPEQFRLCCQCAAAVAGKDAEEINDLYIRITNSKASANGESSKDGLSAKESDPNIKEEVASVVSINPLNFPGGNNTPFAQGNPQLIPFSQNNIPTIVDPPLVTDVNPL